MHTRNLAHAAKRGSVALGFLGVVGALGAGCLRSPVQPGEPTTKQSYVATVKAAGIDKIDILFAIDNSASMGDKQELLRLAVPDLVNRLIDPFCVSETDQRVIAPSRNGDCSAVGGKAEFPPVHDMHIGIVSSALGQRGATDVCIPTDTVAGTGLNRHNDDQGHLLNRAGREETAVPNAGTSNFLAWQPANDKNRDKLPPGGGVLAQGDVATFKGNFQDLVSGVHEFGCGLEAQLESFYRFLIQPDPYNQILPTTRRDAGDITPASLDGIDTTILRQRKDFLRKDSLVAVIMITDENDSTVDPLTIGGQGYRYMMRTFPESSTRHAPRATSACETDPNSKACLSCAFVGVSDPSCQTNGGFYTEAEDDVNLRPRFMKKRFGVDPQFPLDRYVGGLTRDLVPNRFGEHPLDSRGLPSDSYVGDAQCTNPLFAEELPEPPADGADLDVAIRESLCKLKPSLQRRPDLGLVFFALIGGVPWQLLATDPQATAQNVKLKDELTPSDWEAIVGRDYEKYDFTGINQHMLESFEPRPDLAPPTASDTADPLHGREWDSSRKDLMYSCTFPLPEKKNCKLPAPATGYLEACDCTDDKNPPLCEPNPDDDGKRTVQVRGKAYPTIRELLVVKALGAQGIASSICPISVEDHDAAGAVTAPGLGTDPLFGYRPAVKQIIDRLKNALSIQCLPQALRPDQDGNVPCLILETLGVEGPEELCNDAAAYPNRSVPDPAILARVREEQRSQQRGDAGVGNDATKRPVCQLKQLTAQVGESCKDNPDPGWCYVTNEGTNRPAGDKCRQAVLFTEAASRAKGSTFALQCIRATESTTTAPDAATP